MAVVSQQPTVNSPQPTAHSQQPTANSQLTFLSITDYQLIKIMHPEIEALLDRAENRFLKGEELILFKRQIATLSQRLKIYEFLREKEASIFQPVANKLQETFPDEKEETLERSLKHWLLVLRYCAMAMLLNDQNFLEQRLLDWVSGIVEAHQTTKIEATVCNLLQTRLKELLSEQARAILQPFFDQAKSMIIDQGNQE
ncbi:phycobilisome protein [Microcoleus sp. LEGE 07076]|uniref:phycobilisome protein n=1 Tax=Microcoleus sp. LEGE 07076 TaxID=915322 RepID=UPI001D15671D|nr:phycobilisome protein [Microcoleus sp. LEGE 07076]